MCRALFSCTGYCLPLLGLFKPFGANQINNFYFILFYFLKRTVLWYACYLFFFVINIFFFHTQHHNTIFIQNKQNTTKQQTYTPYSKSPIKREIEKKTQNKSFLYTITYIRGKTLPSINSGRLGPINSRRCTFTSHYLQEAMDPICFPHMCGVNHFCIIVFFAAVKPANNIFFCIKLIQRPESSRRHKLGLTSQSICSKEDKTRFTCVQRLMMMGHSQNIWICLLFLSHAILCNDNSKMFSPIRYGTFSKLWLT